MPRKREPDYLLTPSMKREIKARVKANERNTMTENRRIKRELRRRLREGTFDELVMNVSQPGKFINTMFTSSRAYVAAYSFARMEAEYNQRAYYADWG